MFSTQGITNLILASECLLEVKNRSLLCDAEKKLVDLIKSKVEDPFIDRLMWEAVDKMIHTFARVWGGNKELKKWLHECIERDHFVGSYFALGALVQGWSESLDIYKVLLEYASSDYNTAKRFAVLELAKNWKNQAETLSAIKELARQEGEDSAGRQAAIRTLAEDWKDEAETLQIIKEIIVRHLDEGVCSEAVHMLGKFWKDDRDTLDILKKLSKKSQFPTVRWRAVKGLKRSIQSESELMGLFLDVATNDTFIPERDYYVNPREAALEALVEYYPEACQTLDILRNCAINDPDKRLRKWAQKHLEQFKIQNVDSRSRVIHEC